jgi:hypothetical protein
MIHIDQVKIVVKRYNHLIFIDPAYFRHESKIFLCRDVQKELKKGSILKTALHNWTMVSNLVELVANLIL